MKMAAALMAAAASGWLLPLTAAAAAATGSAEPVRAAAEFDVVIANGHIIDGTGSPWYGGDVGIRAGRIAAIGNLSSAPRQRTIDAHGMIVAPGFIDMLGQSELTVLVDPRLQQRPGRSRKTCHGAWPRTSFQRRNGWR